MGIPSPRPSGLEIVDAEGIYLFDRQGKRYIDLVSGVSVSNLGHKHPEIVEAVRKQAEDYMHLMVYGEFIQRPQVRMAEMLARHLPAGLDSTYFVNSGSEADDVALGLARTHTDATDMVVLEHA